MPSQRILICGGGIAGSILAFWLAENDFQVVVVERSRAEQKKGQGLEIEEPALKVVKMMGILDELQEKRTGEEGFNLVDQQSRSWALFKAGGLSPTGALEIMRGDLTEVLYNSANKSANVTFRFETTLQSLSQQQDKVIANLEKRHGKDITTEEFHFVVGADGARSRTRKLAMGSPEELNCFKSIGAYVAYFSIPKENQDWPYSRLCTFPNRRIAWLRPTGKDSQTTSVYLMHLQDNIPKLRQANSTGDRLKQKEAFAELFHGLGWETPRVIEQMMKAENFYSDELAQVKLQKWSHNRVVLLGDAAWAPTPFTGQGNQLAIIGAWVLAQELSRHRSPTALETYEKRLRSYVEDCQSIPLGGYAPKLFFPKTALGVWFLSTILFMVSWISRFVVWTKVMTLLPDVQQNHFDLEIGKDGL